MNSKAQVTVFVIIGIILLLSAGLIIYFTREQAVEPLQRSIQVPEGGQEVYDYVATCVRDLSQEGILLLGQQGGHIELPALIERNPHAYIKADRRGIVKTPHWYFEGEGRVPDIQYMQTSLAKYIKDNLQDCTDEFRVFADRYDVEVLDEPIPVVTFTDLQVITTVRWPIEVKTPTRIIRLNEFIYDHDASIKPMWELATKIMDFENEEAWFENLTIDLMSGQPDIPISGMEFYCGTKKWFLPQVRDEIQNTVHYNLPYVRVENTNYPPPLASEREYDRLKRQAEDIRSDLEAGREPNWPKDPPEDVFQMNRMRFDVGAEKTDFKVAFIHQKDWPILVNAQPSRGAIMSSAQMKGPRKYLRFLCVNQYHFAYDLIYPVKTVIRDDRAFNGEGYLFQFGFPVLIEDNDDARPYFGMRRFIAPDTGVDFCTQFSDQSVDVRAQGFVEGSPVAEEMEDVNITFRCMSYECDLGKTIGDGSGAIRLNTLLPEGCGNPLLIRKKDGYLPGQQHFTGESEKLDLMLTKLKEFNYTIQVYPYYEEVSRNNPLVATDSRWLEGQEYTKFSPTTHATIAITLRDDYFDQYLLYPAESEQVGEGLADISDKKGSDVVSFVYGDANYDIDIILFKGDTPVGGYHAENITIRAEDMIGKENVLFKVIEYRPLPAEGFQQAGMFTFLFERGKYSDGRPYEEVLKPVFT